MKGFVIAISYLLLCLKYEHILYNWWNKYFKLFICNQSVNMIFDSKTVYYTVKVFIGH